MDAGELRLAAEYHRGYADGLAATFPSDVAATRELLEEFAAEVIRSYLLDGAGKDGILDEYAKRLRVR